jgi:hypothetical protein
VKRFNADVKIDLRSRSLLAVSSLFLLAIAGCKRDAVREYSTPKEIAAAPAAQTALPTGHPAMGGAQAELPPTPKISWTKLPTGWTEKLSSAMRAASFAVEVGNDVAEVAVIPLPLSGQEVELVNMWRQQMQLPTVAAAEVDKLATPVTISSAPGKIFDMASDAPIIEGKAKGRILVAMLVRDGVSWFFKMTGEEKFVASQKNSFTDFLKDVSFPEARATAPAPVAAASAPVSEAGSGLPQWSAPASWQTQAPGQMQLAAFSVAGGKATLTVSSFPGDVGGALANVNRWRGQLGLAPIAAGELTSALTPAETGGGAAQIADASGVSERLIGAILPRDGATWFFKLKGEAAAVASEKENFTAFLKSLKF